MAQSKPSFRTVEVSLDAPYDGWTATLKAEGIPARVLIDLQSSDIGKQLGAMEKLIIAHNFLDPEGSPAASVLDAPMDALTGVISKWGDLVAALPPR